MTSNERKIVKCLWEAKGKAHIQLIARQTGLSQDYARMLGRSLERAGYIKFADMNLCHLLTKGRARFQSNASLLDGSAEVTMASVAAPAISVGDDITEDIAPKEAEDLSPASSAGVADDSDLDKALAEVGVSYPFHPVRSPQDGSTGVEELLTSNGVQKDEEASEKNEESAKAETSTQSIEPQIMAEAEKKEPEVLQTAEPTQAVSVELPQVTEEKIADSSAPTASSESPEQVVPKEEPAKPSEGTGWSFKRVVDWFAAKK